MKSSKDIYISMFFLFLNFIEILLLGFLYLYIIILGDFKFILSIYIYIYRKNIYKKKNKNCKFRNILN